MVLKRALQQTTLANFVVPVRNQIRLDISDLCCKCQALFSLKFRNVKNCVCCPISCGLHFKGEKG